MTDYKIYEQHITTLNEKIKMPENAHRKVLEICRAVCGSEELFAKYKDIEARYFAGTGDTRDEVFALGEENGFNRYEFALALCEMYSLHTLEIYRWRQYPMDVYYDSFLDLVIWSRVCEGTYGVFGIENYGWVSSQIRAKIFRLGRLQFHFIRSNFDYSRAGVHVRPNQLVINIHIPEGDGITREKRYDSYRRAYEFFEQTGNAVFVCSSWLLYPGHEEFLYPESNILDFMHDFEIINSSESPNGLGGDTWRVFGYGKYESPADYPERTRLQRAYKQRLLEKKPTGGGYGVFIFDGEKILK